MVIPLPKEMTNFGITFPTELDLNMKGLLLGAVFLIDFVHFERRQNS